MVKIGVLGCSFRTKYMLKLLAEKINVEIIGLYDQAPGACESYQTEFGTESKIYENVDELTSNPEIEWVFMGSINCEHETQLLSALEHGKNVFSEKPLAMSFDELLNIKKKFEEKGKSFLLSYPLRYSPHYKKVKDILESGKLGKIVSFEFNETLEYRKGAFFMGNWRRFEKYSGGHLLEKCCHDFDVTNFLVKSVPTKIASFGGRNIFNPENNDLMKDLELKRKEYERSDPINPFTSEKDIVDNQVVILEYRNGVRATFHTNSATMMPERRIYICGTKGTLRTDVLKGILQVRFLGSSETVTIIDDAFRGGHGAGDPFLIEELIEAINDKEKTYSALDDGIKSAATALAAEKSRKEGKIVDLEPIWKDFGY